MYQPKTNKVERGEYEGSNQLFRSDFDDRCGPDLVQLGSYVSQNVGDVGIKGPDAICISLLELLF